MKSRFSGQAVVYIGSAGLTAMLPFLLLPFLARWLGPSDFGIVATFAALVSVLGTVIGLNVHGLIGVAFYREGEQAMARQIAASLAVLAGTSSLALLLVGAVATDIGRFTGIEPFWLPAIVIAAAGQFIIAAGLTSAQSLGRPWVYGMFQVGFAAGLVVLTVGLVGVIDLGWRGRILAQMLSACAVAAAAILWLMTERRIAWRGLRESGAKALAFGLPLMPHSLAAVVMASSDRFVLGAHAGAASVGQYFLAFQIASILLVLATALNQAWLPWLYERLARDDAAARRQIGRALTIALSVLAGAAACIAILAPVLIPLVGGPRYAAAILPLQILAPGFAGQAFYMLVSGFLFYEHRTGLLSVVSMTVACVQIVLLLALVRYGAVGVAVAQALTGVLYALATTLAARFAYLSARRAKAAKAPMDRPLA